MISIDFEKRGEKNLSEWIYYSIKQQIINKELNPEEKLPSKRVLASHLGVSVITVANAYEQLISEGYLYSIEKKGFFVTDLSEVGEFLLKKNENAGDCGNLPEDSFVTKNSCTDESEKNDSESQLTADFTSNSISYEMFPFYIWSKEIRKILKSPHENLLNPCPVQGVYELRNQISIYLKKFRGMNVTPEQIIVGSGSEYLYSLIVNILGRDKVYAVENPGYKKTSRILTMNGVQWKAVPMDASGIMIQKLKDSSASVVHVSPSHHYPTGIVMPVLRRYELLEWLSADDNRYIVEDDYDSEFRFSGKVIQPLFCSDSSNRTLYMNTFSKTIAPSLRISYLVLPVSLLPVFYERAGFCSNTVSTFEQYTLASFIADGFYEKHLIRMKNYYRNLRNAFIAAISETSLSKITRIEEENSGLHFLLYLDKNLPVDQIVDSLRSFGVKIFQLSEFFYRENSESKDIRPEDFILVVNYSGLKRKNILEITKKLEKIIKKS